MTTRVQSAAPQRRNGYLRLGEYAAIGDGRTLGLVGADGSIDWMCLPNLDGSSIFGALLNPHAGGHFVIQPAISFEVSRRYLERTNVLETTFSTAEGQVRLVDALTLDNSRVAPWRELARRVEGLAGEVPMRWSFEPRFGPNGEAPAAERRDGAAVFRHRGLQVGLQCWGAGSSIAGGRTQSGEFVSRPGEESLLVMTAVEAEPLPLPERDAIERRLSDTVEVWQSWTGRHTYRGPWRDAVERSLLAIRLLTDGRTGAIAAAGTTSLPEVIGGKRNYDYGFAWVRDASFSLDALLAVGMEELTHTSVTWLLEAVSRTHPRVDPVYALDGSVVRSQSEVPIPGYRHTTPVHRGNQAGSQLQLGGFGDLLETASLYVSHCHVLSPAIGERLADVVDLLSLIWRCEDAGLWELNQTAHYGTSKLGCWVAFERVLGLVARGQAPARHVDRWRRKRDEVREFIERHLWSEQKRSYLQKRGSDALDCGTLLAARRGFGDPTGHRMNGTIDAIRTELGAGSPLLYRYSGMQEEENAFLACSFWLVEALALAHRLDEAAELMDGLVRLANDVGLYSEEIEPSSKELRGNLPQALTHLSLINAATAFSRTTAEVGGDQETS
jgi:GH15 family glucan-1,4-alpha-glucosidase